MSRSRGGIDTCRVETRSEAPETKDAGIVRTHHVLENTMFERYTERARRVIFFARYEASQFGSTTIETEHTLLGLIREDANLMNRFRFLQVR